MSTDFVFITTYQCPRCRVALESRASGPPSWLRCPNCLRASLPPEFVRSPRSPRNPQPDPYAFVIDDVAPVGVSTTRSPERPRALAPLVPKLEKKPPTARLMIGTGFFLTTFLFLFTLLEGNGVRAVIFGGVAGGLLFLLSRPGGAPLKE